MHVRNSSDGSNTIISSQTHTFVCLYILDIWVWANSQVLFFILILSFYIISLFLNYIRKSISLPMNYI